MKLIVLGVTGGIGYAVAQEAAQQGHEVVGLTRKASFALEGVSVVVGDAADKGLLDELLTDADVVLHGINVPYSKWDPLMKEHTERILQAAARHSVTMLFSGNVYGFGAAQSPISETNAREASTKKGRLRNTLLQQMRVSDVQCIVGRAGDFLGSVSNNTWQYHLTSKAASGGKLLYPGPLELHHSWASVEDFAKVLVKLADRREELPRFSEWHFAGNEVTGHEFIDVCREVLGDPDRKVSSFPWTWMQLLRPFVADINELFEMRYLWQRPLALDDSKLREFLGEVPLTPLKDSLMRIFAAP